MDCPIIEDGELCGAPIYARELCQKHYRRLQRYDDPTFRKRGWNKITEGERFGYLIVLGEAGRSSAAARLLRVRCEACGKEKVMRADGVRRAKSCGCLAKTHGHAYGDGPRCPTATYRSWAAMLRRCTNPASEYYDRYGGRGITVCDRWRAFENFLADMGERPEGKTIDRIDNDGNYEPGNCRWATAKEQQHNKPPKYGTVQRVILTSLRVCEKSIDRIASEWPDFREKQLGDAISRMEHAGLVEAGRMTRGENRRWRRIYQLTARGRDAAATLSKEEPWDEGA